MATLFIIANVWKQNKCASTRWMDKEVIYIYIYIYMYVYTHTHTYKSYIIHYLYMLYT